MAISKETPQRLRELVNSGYLPTIERWAKRMSAPFWWSDPEGEEDRIRGGTICFVDTGQKLLGVTAAHVHTEYVNRKEALGDLWCQIGGSSFDPEERLIDLNSTTDLATYAISEIQVNAAVGDIHHAPTWPPAINDKDAYVVGGWPWSLSRPREREVTHSFLHFVARLTTASEEKLGVLTYTSTSVPWGRTPLPVGTNLGGMSGGPLYRMHESGLAFLTLVGIVFEYQPSFEIAFARPLGLVEADGSVRSA